MADITVDGGRLRAAGALDPHAEMPFRDALSKLLSAESRVVAIDLTEVEVITSVCVGALVSTWIDIRTGGRTMALRVSPHVRRILDMMGLTSVLMRTNELS